MLYPRRCALSIPDDGVGDAVDTAEISFRSSPQFQVPIDTSLLRTSEITRKTLERMYGCQKGGMGKYVKRARLHIMGGLERLVCCANTRAQM